MSSPYGPARIPRHKVFVSYHHANDQPWKDQFQRVFADAYEILVSRSVGFGDIDPSTSTDEVRRRIREQHLQQTTVTVVLVGAQTWQRKHVDWEIGYSITTTRASERSGLLGIVLPTFRSTVDVSRDRYVLPPRLVDNLDCDYATLHPWSGDPVSVARWIHAAYERRTSRQPNNQRPYFGRNRTEPRWQN